MLRHSSITDQYVDDLKNRFFETNELAKFAGSWSETSAILHTKTIRFSQALRLIKDGASLNQVEEILKN